ncbi:hypothetical protein CAR_50p530 (plasmid) [Carnobacterium sp. 17-4]|uniref:hypothetical protein n=1 Tax=Carnobacterium sp. (strain 17-4) TaxID=208596 RepID=UPI00020584AF|nr:hypothetical protein [Carnobacterium sp. 17-4]AEB31225.1 hypothetical protein CAR_50p530 [Carnobacterium sp. 17-4]
MEKRVDFSLSMLFFWVKGFISVDSRFVKVSGANTILGIIPAGRDNQSIPLKNISSARISTSYKIKPMLVGIILIFIAINMLGDNVLGALILLLIGVGILGSGMLSVLIIQRAGSDFYISVPFFDKGKLLQAQDMIEEALSYDTDKGDLNMFFEKKQ